MKVVQGEISPCDAEGHMWDTIVIGAGAGGATAGFNLARLGRSVLFVERGKLLHHDATVVRGVSFSWTDDPEAALNHGWWPRSFLYRQGDDAPVPRKPPVGSGAGGSTAQFDAVMDRFRPQDFTPGRFFRNVSDSSLPEAWPITYEEMAPFYEQAESLHRVRGTQDPLAPKGGVPLLEPPPASQRELAISDALRSAGLNPYRLHSALERAPGCTGCAGMLCPRACRNDSARICLYPALEQHAAKILANSRAIRFEARGSAVERVICERDGRQIALRARVFIVAANAFLTPALLQRSASERFPDGLANSSGLVGRNLMLHAASHLFVRLKQNSRTPGPNLNHGLSLNDFYVYNGTKLGNFHAHPVVTRDQLIPFLAQHYGGLRFLPGRLLSMIASMWTSLSVSWTVFATIVEDLPYTGNYVAAKSGSDEDIGYTYRYSGELRHRSQLMNDAFTSAVAPLFDVRALQPTGVLNGSHVCGTCRFGDDPRTSVLDRDCRAHDLDNFYVLDASFFPSSGGLNPSLTIVANSLRVTDKIAQRL